MVLLVDYIMSLQFFRTFRASALNLFSCPDQDLMPLKISSPLISDDKLLTSIQEYLTGLKDVLAGQPVGSWPGAPSLWRIAQAILESEVASAWIKRDCGNWIKRLEQEPEWNAAPEQVERQQFPLITLVSLDVLFLKRMEGESKRHTAGALMSNEDDEVFTETDRIVLRLLQPSPSPNGKGHHHILET